MLNNVRNIEEICSLFTEIVYHQDKDIIRCKLCASEQDIKYSHKKTPGIITYKKSEDTIGSTLSDYFRNVKKFLKKHMDTQIHKESINRLKMKKEKNSLTKQVLLFVMKRMLV